MNRLRRSRTPQDLLAAQAELTRRSLADIWQSVAVAAELAAETAREAAKALEPEEKPPARPDGQDGGTR
jgi:hypothetical protein